MVHSKQNKDGIIVYCTTPSGKELEVAVSNMIKVVSRVTVVPVNGGGGLQNHTWCYNDSDKEEIMGKKDEDGELAKKAMTVEAKIAFEQHMKEKGRISKEEYLDMLRKIKLED